LLINSEITILANQNHISGSVYRGKLLSKNVAVRVLDDQSLDGCETLKQECQLRLFLSENGCPNIVPLEGGCMDPGKYKIITGGL